MSLNYQSAIQVRVLSIIPNCVRYKLLVLKLYATVQDKNFLINNYLSFINTIKVVEKHLLVCFLSWCLVSERSVQAERFSPFLSDP